MGDMKLIQEVRGVMTRFEPLTPKAIIAAGSEVTYDEIVDTLTAYGLDVHKVVHDPSRKIFNTYYADYECGQYATICLQGDYLRRAGQLELRNLANYGGICPALQKRDWNTYYSQYVPLPMLIYDFERRYKDIPAEQVFLIWHHIYKRIDYGNDMWTPEVLNCVLHCAPPSKLPAVDSDGLITIYRGMGELSQPPEWAISWSSHPGNALWFANRSGRGTRIVVARVRPEQIVAYFGGYAEENEVLVLPGSIKKYHYEDMIPASFGTVLPMLVPILLNYQFYGRQAKSMGYELERTPFHVHGISHTLRVLLLSLLYIQHSGDRLSEADQQILIYFSLFHDIGRTNEGRDNHHGEQSVELIRKKNIRVRGIRLSRREYQIAHLIIALHCVDDTVGEAAIMAVSWLSRKEKAHVVHLYNICKDMDGLDRVRFNGLDYRLLRTKYAKRLPLIAGCLLEEDILTPLDMEI